jgi:hypothetical protein
MTRASHWTDSLFDSVYALYEAAHEYQIAHRAAGVAVQSVAVDRRQIHDGEIDSTLRLNDSGDTRTRRRRPHEHAVFTLLDLYGKTERQLHHSFEHAALLYATGAVWAINAVQGGGTPAVVEFARDADGVSVRHPVRLPYLDRYAEAAQLKAAHDRLADCLDAERYAEQLAGAEHVADHEAGDMFRAGEVAEGIADAAFAYGLLAQRALNFVLLGPRLERDRARAAARAGLPTAN